MNSRRIFLMQGLYWGCFHFYRTRTLVQNISQLKIKLQIEYLKKIAWKYTRRELNLIKNCYYTTSTSKRSQKQMHEAHKEYIEEIWRCNVCRKDIKLLVRYKVFVGSVGQVYKFITLRLCVVMFVIIPQLMLDYVRIFLTTNKYLYNARHYKSLVSGLMPARSWIPPT